MEFQKFNTRISLIREINNINKKTRSVLNYFNSSTRFFANKSNNPLRKDRGVMKEFELKEILKKTLKNSGF